jgi:DNA polymerase III sliding clamp (beta) subunit (PCNA family)
MRVEINEILFKQMIDGVKHCVGKEDYRPILQYIQIAVKDDTVTAYALDGYRAGKTQIKLKEPNADKFICFIKPFPFKPLKNGINTVVIETGDNNTYVEVITEFGKVRYSFKYPEGKYIDIEKIFEENKDHDRELGMSAHYVAQACRALQNIANHRSFVVLETKENNLRPFIIRAKGEGITNEQLILPVRFTENEED